MAVLGKTSYPTWKGVFYRKVLVILQKKIQFFKQIENIKILILI